MFVEDFFFMSKEFVETHYLTNIFKLIVVIISNLTECFNKKKVYCTCYLRKSILLRLRYDFKLNERKKFDSIERRRLVCRFDYSTRD